MLGSDFSMLSHTRRWYISLCILILIALLPQTVKENLMYSARFRLPRGTSYSDLEDLADFTLASLGLSRVANSIVGDVNRRGVSGGERKRVNIGTELMARPEILFLDEPTSGRKSQNARRVWPL